MMQQLKPRFIDFDMNASAHHLMDDAPSNHKQHPIAIVDKHPLQAGRYGACLKRNGYTQITLSRTLGDIHHTIFESNRLCIINLALTHDFEMFTTLLQLARYRGSTGRLVLMAETVTCETLYRLVILGIRDFWLQGRNLIIEKEVENLLKPPPHNNMLSPYRATSLGLFRTAGLTQREIELMTVLADGFPRQCHIAQKLERSPAYIHKMFSRIYEKLNVSLGVDNTPKLAHLLTLCSLFR